MMKGALDIQSAGTDLAVASQGEAEAGVDNTKAMTPLRVAQAIAALGGSGGGAWDRVTHVDGDSGDDATGDGSAGAPYRTLAQAFAEGGRAFVVAGSVGDLSSAATVDVTLFGLGKGRSVVGNIALKNGGSVLGNGLEFVTVGQITNHGADGAAGVLGGANGADGVTPAPLLVAGVTAYSVATRGGKGGGGAGGGGGLPHGGTGGNGGHGGNAGELTVRDCHIMADVSTTGGAGGNGGMGGAGLVSADEAQGAGGNGGNGGNGGAGSVVTLHQSVVAGTVQGSVGAGGLEGLEGWGPEGNGSVGFVGTDGESGGGLVCYYSRLGSTHSGVSDGNWYCSFIGTSFMAAPA